MPDISQCSTGRKIIMKSGSPEGSANSSYISRSKLTGRMLYFKGVGEDIDTTINSRLPDWNGAHVIYIRLTVRKPLDEIERGLIKCPCNKILHLYCSHELDGANAVGVYEVEGNSYKTKKVTWNTQPVIGNFIETIAPVLNTWSLIHTGTKGSVCLKFLDESGWSGYYRFYSSNYSDKDFTPYITDEG